MDIPVEENDNIPNIISLTRLFSKLFNLNIQEKKEKINKEKNNFIKVFGKHCGSKVFLHYTAILLTRTLEI